jgi:hypothetical protein
MTLRRWAEAGGGAKKTKRKTGKKTRAAAAPARLAITTPDGHRIEVDNTKDLAAVLKALS